MTERVKGNGLAEVPVEKLHSQQRDAFEFTSSPEWPENEVKTMLKEAPARANRSRLSLPAKLDGIKPPEPAKTEEGPDKERAKRRGSTGDVTTAREGIMKRPKVAESSSEHRVRFDVSSDSEQSGNFTVSKAAARPPRGGRGKMLQRLSQAAGAKKGVKKDPSTVENPAAQASAVAVKRGTEKPGASSAAVVEPAIVDMPIKVKVKGGSDKPRGGKRPRPVSLASVADKRGQENQGEDEQPEPRVAKAAKVTKGVATQKRPIVIVHSGLTGDEKADIEDTVRKIDPAAKVVDNVRGPRDPCGGLC